MQLFRFASFVGLVAAHPLSNLEARNASAIAAPIQFQTYALGDNLKFGIALPATADGKNDFVGQLVSSLLTDSSIKY
jgi:hypothetical protein